MDKMFNNNEIFPAYMSKGRTFLCKEDRNKRNEVGNF